MENPADSKANILLVDDDVLIAESTKFSLKKSGYNIVGIAVDASRAVELTKTKNPDLIVMDINLGSVLDGISAAEEIKKFADIPVIFLTAYSDPDTIERVKKVGPYGYLIKPFDSRELIIAIETSLVKHSYEKEIKERELLFRTVANFAYEWEFWIRPDYSFKYCSPSCLRITGYSAEEFVGNKELMFQIVHPDDKASFGEMLEYYFVDDKEKVITGFQYRIISKAGEVKSLSHTCSPIYDEKGNYLGRRVTNVDVTERTKAEESLRRSEERFKQVISCSGAWVWEVNADGLYTYASPTVESILGYDADEIVGKKYFYDFFVPDQKEELKILAFQMFLKKEIIKNFENPNVRKDGNIVILETTGMPLLDDKGNLIGYRGADQDITDRKTIERALTESENRLRFALEGSNDGLWDVHMQTGKVFLSPRGCEILGYNPNESDKIASVWSDLVHPDDMPITGEKLNSHLNGESQVFQVQQRLRTKSGEWRWVLTRGKLVSRDSNGNPLRMTGTHTDIHERKLAEAELEKYRFHLEELVETRTEELDKLNNDLIEQLRKGTELQLMLQQSLQKEKELSELKTRFISTASHEFRTPLTLILTSAGLIQRYGKKWTEEKLLEYIDKIKRSVDYLTKLLDDVLTINKSESGKLFFNPEMVDLYSLCLEIIEETKFHAASNYNFDFSFSLRKIKYSLDPKLIRFILSNLLSNAFKYSPNGGNIRLFVQSANEKIKIIFEDEGIGIPEEDKKHLYEPFHRASNTNEIPGTGLGLSIVKRSVDLHGGSITVDSKLGTGTTFTVLIPKKTL